MTASPWPRLGLTVSITVASAVNPNQASQAATKPTTCTGPVVAAVCKATPTIAVAAVARTTR